MLNQNVISLPRLWQLIKNDLRMHSKPILIAGITIFIICALLPFHMTQYSTLYFVILYAGGLIISSFAFSELHDKRKAHFFLMLPCSNLERFLNRWFLTSIGYAIGLLVIYTLFSLLSMGVNLLVFKQHITVFNPLQADLWIGIGNYIVLQSIVLLGASIFKKYVLIKTVLSLACLFLAYKLVMFLVVWVFCPNCFQYALHFNFSSNAVQSLICLAVTVICWIVTYLRLTERELT